MLNDVSLICQFNLSHWNGLVSHLIACTEEIFSLFDYKIKKIFTSFDRKVWSPGYKKFKLFTNPDYFYSISFQSDYNSCDFEPQTHLYVRIDNSRTKGSEYIFPEPLVKFTVVINDAELLKNAEKTYKGILLLLSKISRIKLTSYSFRLPNSYGAVSFSQGILRKPDMSDSLKYLARGYNGSDIERDLIGLFNCFTDLTKRQSDVLKKLFGEENVEVLNDITFFKNESINALGLDDYYTSAEYCQLCDKLETEFCFVRTF